MQANRTLTFRAILGPDGIENDRSVEIGPDGRIVGVRPGGAPHDGFMALPGMPNAHSHVFQRALAGHGEAAGGEAAGGEDSFWSWRAAMYRLAAALDAERLYDIARRAYAEMLRGGFTSVVEFHYLHHGPGGERGPETTAAVVEAARDVGLPMTLLPVYYRTSGFDGEPALPEQRRFAHDSVEDFLASLEALGPLAGGVAPHSLRAVPRAELAPLVAGADAILGPDRPIHIHVSEQEGEVEACRERFGAAPIDLLADAVELGPRWQLVHATHATSAERERIRAAGAGVVLCPLTEAYLGDGVFEAREHRRAGGIASIGSDADVRIEAIEELRQLEYGQRLRDRRRARLADEGGLGAPLWSWLADGGARAAGIDAGAVAPGRRADLVVLDAEGPAIAGHDPRTALDAWLVGGDGRDIAAVYVAGERRVERGRIADEEEIGRRFVRALRSLA